MKICIYGAGAIGGYMAAELADAGAAEVTCIARGPHLAAMRANGLTLRTADGEKRRGGSLARVTRRLRRERPGERVNERTTARFIRRVRRVRCRGDAACFFSNFFSADENERARRRRALGARRPRDAPHDGARGLHRRAPRELKPLVGDGAAVAGENPAAPAHGEAPLQAGDLDHQAENAVDAPEMTMIRKLIEFLDRAFYGRTQTAAPTDRSM